MRNWLAPVALTAALGVWPGAGPAAAQSGRRVDRNPHGLG